MLWNGKGMIKTEEGEPAIRSCWECNPAHEHLKTVNALHMCFNCGRFWVFDRFMDSFDSDDEIDAYFAGRGLQPGDSTTKIDAGYRLVCSTVRQEELPYHNLPDLPISDG